MRDSGIESAGIALCYIIHVALYYSVGQGDRHVSKASPVLRHPRMKQFAQECASKCVPSRGYIPHQALGASCSKLIGHWDGMDAACSFRAGFEGTWLYIESFYEITII